MVRIRNGSDEYIDIINVKHSIMNIVFILFTLIIVVIYDDCNCIDDNDNDNDDV